MPPTHSASGLEAAFLENRGKLLAFLRARGAGEAAEDLVQEIWLRISASRRSAEGSGPVAAPLAYLFRTADTLMIDRFRSLRQAEKRERDWTEIHVTGAGPEPSAERRLAAAQEAGRVLAALDGLGPRVAAIFRRHRVEGVPQKAVAAEFGVSLSTVESDLRTAYRALGELKERLDEA